MVKIIATASTAALASLGCLFLVAQAQQTYTYRITPTAFTIEPSSVLAISSPDNHCAVEPSPKAINPKIVECHAAFAPVPVIPPLLSQTTPQQRDAAGAWLMSQLDQPGVCGKDEKLARDKSCASLIYVLREADRVTGVPVSAAMPWVYVVNIYRISHLQNASDQTLSTVNSNASESRFGPGKDPVWHLLTEQRIAKRCMEGKTTTLGTGVTGSGMKPDACRGTSGNDWRYEPMLLLPHSKAKIVLNKKLADTIFDAPAYVVQDVEDAMREFTGANAKLK